MNFPCYDAGQVISAPTGVSSVTALAGSAERVQAARDLLVWNPGPNLVYIRAGDASATADATCAPVPAGQSRIYAKSMATHIAALAITGAQNITVITGTGS